MPSHVPLPQGQVLITPALRRNNILLAAGLGLFIAGVYSYTYRKMKTVRRGAARRGPFGRRQGMGVCWQGIARRGCTLPESAAFMGGAHA
jgi:hypothetical protein